jgi:hypothetical protein
MPITSYWDSEDQHIYRIDFVEQWSVEDLAQAWATCRSLMDASEYPVDLIMDFTRTQLVPAGITGVFGQARLLFDHPKIGLTLAVGAGLAVRTFAKIFLQMFAQYDSQIVFVATLEQAYATFSGSRITT